MREIISLLLVVFIIHFSYGQKDHLSSKKGETSLGIGLGLSYGGVGMRLGTNLSDGLNLFGGIGYQISGVGFNIGLVKDFPSSAQSQFYVLGMYGTNAAIKVEGLPEYDNLYTGATFGLGMKINSRKTKGNYWDLGLLLPIKSSAFKTDEETIRNDPRVATFNTAWPILIQVGYNFNI